MATKEPRSDSPLDFFLWGHLKSIVYSEKICNIAHLRQRIVEALASVTPDMLLNTWKETEYRLDVARATNGAHIELY